MKKMCLAIYCKVLTWFLYWITPKLLGVKPCIMRRSGDMETVRELHDELDYVRLKYQLKRNHWVIINNRCIRCRKPQQCLYKQIMDNEELRHKRYSHFSDLFAIWNKRNPRDITW